MPVNNVIPSEAGGFVPASAPSKQIHQTQRCTSHRGFRDEPGGMSAPRGIGAEHHFYRAHTTSAATLEGFPKKEEGEWLEEVS